jgi:hypothetical protein
MIKNFTIYGERCSGTNFLERYFHSYTQLPVTWEFGWKHFFGYNDEKIISNGDYTLFLCIVRNPYQWLMSMNKKRHHTLGGKKKKDFFTSEWKSVETKHPGYHPEIMQDRNTINHQRYKNIFEMRKYKCRYLWYELPLYAKNNFFIRYEDLIHYGPNIIFSICNDLNIPIKNSSVKEQPSFRQIYQIEPQLLHLFNNNIHWQTENTIGYTKEE